MACEKLPLHDGTVVTLCFGRHQWRKCDFCDVKSGFACDHPVIRKGQQRACNRRLCDRHRKNIGKDLDLCPAHATQYELNGNQFVIGAVSLDPKADRPAEKPAILPSDSKAFYNVFKPGSGWLSHRGANGSRSYISDRSKAASFPGGTALDVTVRVYKLQPFVVVPSLFPMGVIHGE